MTFCCIELCYIINQFNFSGWRIIWRVGQTDEHTIFIKMLSLNGKVKTMTQQNWFYYDYILYEITIDKLREDL